jgi:hypothetical protein
MTRTERSHSLRALARDRSEARNGMDTSVPKGGAGAHNWGSIHSEYYHENAALDEGDEFEEQAAAGGGGKRLLFMTYSYCTLSVEHAMFNVLSSSPAASQPPPKTPAVVRRTSSVTEEDRENALKIRKNALKSNGGMFFYETPLSFYPVMTTPF